VVYILVLLAYIRVYICIYLYILVILVYTFIKYKYIGLEFTTVIIACKKVCAMGKGKDSGSNPQEDKKDISGKFYSVYELQLPQELDSFMPTERGKAELIKIEKGKVGDFFKKEAIEKILKYSNDTEKTKNWLNTECLNLTFRTQETNAQFSKILTIKIGKNSNLAKYIKRYGYPKKGQIVEWVLNANNFPELLL